MSEFLSTATLPDEYQQPSKTVRDFAREVVAPVSAQHDADTPSVRGRRGDGGRWDCSGCRSRKSTAVWAETTSRSASRWRSWARVDQSVAITLEGGVSLGAMPVYRFGTEAQKQQWLPLLTSGTALGAFGLTEAGGGTDAGATRTTARRRRALGDQRVQAVHHELRNRHHPSGDRYRGDRDGGRSARDLRDHGAGSPPGFVAEPAWATRSAGTPRTPIRSRSPMCGPGGEPARRAGRGYANFCASSTRAASPSQPWRPGRRRGASTNA